MGLLAAITDFSIVITDFTSTFLPLDISSVIGEVFLIMVGLAAWRVLS